MVFMVTHKPCCRSYNSQRHCWGGRGVSCQKDRRSVCSRGCCSTGVETSFWRTPFLKKRTKENQAAGRHSTHIILDWILQERTSAHGKNRLLVDKEHKISAVDRARTAAASAVARCVLTWVHLWIHQAKLCVRRCRSGVGWVLCRRVLELAIEDAREVEAALQEKLKGDAPILQSTKQQRSPPIL